MTIGEIAIAVLTSSAFTGLLVEIIREIRKAVDKRQNKGLAKLENDIRKIHDTVDHMSKTVDKVETTLADRAETDKVLLHDRIWEMFNELRDSPFVTVEDLANLEYLFQEYSALGGNHKAEIMFNAIENKPLAPNANTDEIKEGFLA